MTILELDTGLFPDAPRVTAALDSLSGPHQLARADLRGLAPDDDAGWAKIAEAILAADRVVTL